MGTGGGEQGLSFTLSPEVGAERASPEQDVTVESRVGCLDAHLDAAAVSFLPPARPPHGGGRHSCWARAWFHGEDGMVGDRHGRAGVSAHLMLLVCGEFPLCARQCFRAGDDTAPTPGAAPLPVYTVMEETDRKSTRQAWLMTIMTGRYIDTGG